MNNNWNVSSGGWLNSDTYNDKDRDNYERDLRKRQEDHLKRVQDRLQKQPVIWQPCLHDQCSKCHGTSVDENGNTCLHFISCNCPKCSPSYIFQNNAGNEVDRV